MEKKLYEFERFEIKQIHLDLLKQSIWRFNDMCEGSVGMDIKRPYGNSDPLDDILEELKIEKVELGDRDEGYLEEYNELAQQIHEEMVVVMDIICKTQQVSMGIYENVKFGEKFSFSTEWKKEGNKND